jgi:hypothetical protein
VHAKTYHEDPKCALGRSEGHQYCKIIKIPM